MVSLMVQSYLLSRGEVTMVSCLHGNCNDLRHVAECSDHLGWVSLVEGWVSSHWLELVAPFLWRQLQYLLQKAWGRQFITKLHNVLHKQWIYQNLYIHHKGKDGWTMPQIQNIIAKVNGYSLLDPETLLPRHRFLLEADFGALGDGPTSNRLLWLADMDSAILAATLAELGTLTGQAVAFFADDSGVSHCY